MAWQSHLDGGERSLWHLCGRLLHLLRQWLGQFERLSLISICLIQYLLWSITFHIKNWILWSRRKEARSISKVFDCHTCHGGKIVFVFVGLKILLLRLFALDIQQAIFLYLFSSKDLGLYLGVERSWARKLFPRRTAVWPRQRSRTRTFLRLPRAKRVETRPLAVSAKLHDSKIAVNDRCYRYKMTGMKVSFRLI